MPRVGQLLVVKECILLCVKVEKRTSQAPRRDSCSRMYRVLEYRRLLQFHRFSIISKGFLLMQRYTRPMVTNPLPALLTVPGLFAVRATLLHSRHEQGMGCVTLVSLSTDGSLIHILFLFHLDSKFPSARSN